jgi:Haloacid dehalogenase-like hydrolase
MVGGVLLDVDGVLTVSWRALPGAVRTIGWLREQCVGFRLVTNTSSRSRRQISDLLGDAEMPVDAGHIVTRDPRFFARTREPVSACGIGLSPNTGAPRERDRGAGGGDRHPAIDIEDDLQESEIPFDRPERINEFQCDRDTALTGWGSQRRYRSGAFSDRYAARGRCRIADSRSRFGLGGFVGGGGHILRLGDRRRSDQPRTQLCCHCA